MHGVQEAQEWEQVGGGGAQRALGGQGHFARSYKKWYLTQAHDWSLSKESKPGLAEKSCEKEGLPRPTPHPAK